MSCLFLIMKQRGTHRRYNAYRFNNILSWSRVASRVQSWSYLHDHKEVVDQQTVQLYQKTSCHIMFADAHFNMQHYAAVSSLPILHFADKLATKMLIIDCQNHNPFDDLQHDRQSWRFRIALSRLLCVDGDSIPDLHSFTKSPDIGNRSFGQ